MFSPRYIPVSSDNAFRDLSLIQNIYGPMQIGIFLSMILYGVLIIQMYHYYITYKDDQWKVRYLVLYLLIVETIHCGFLISIIYQPLIHKFGQNSVLIEFPRMLPAEAILTVSVSSPIQLLVAWRLWTIQESLWIPAIVGILSCMSTVGGVWDGISVIFLRTFANSHRSYPAVYLWLISAAAADLLITGALSYTLYRRKTGSASSDAVISRIIAFTIQNGLITSLAAIADIILLISVPHLTINWIFEVMLVKLYANNLMTTLNARETLNKNWNNQHSKLFHDRVDLINVTKDTVDSQLSASDIVSSTVDQEKSTTSAVVRSHISIEIAGDFKEQA